MEFIGREAELQLLNEEYQKDSSFVVVYGRRRVGKTTLLKEFIRDKYAFYFLATQETEAQSRKRLAGVIARRTGNALLDKVLFTDWMDLFQAIVDHPSGEKKIIVIDEFPYLVKTSAAFPSILQNIWDELLKDSGVMLILCGSLTGMMKKYALDYGSPLYGRRTAQIRLMPLGFMEVYKAQNRSFTEAVTQYAVTGGVPKYLELFEGGRSFGEQIEGVILRKNGFLYEEPYFLLNEEVNTPMHYFSIIQAISDGNHKLGKIGTALGVETSALTPYLSTLIDLGYLSKDVPLTEKSPEKSRKGLYFVADHFLRFWFHYVYPFRGELEMDNRQIVLDQLAKDFEERFVALAYEAVCRNIFLFLCREGEIDFTPSRIGAYWVNDKRTNIEIDVVAVDRQHQILFAGECKYHHKPVDLSVYSALQGKVEDALELKRSFPGYRIWYGLFSKSGFTQRMKEVAREREDIYLIQDAGLERV